MGNRLLFLREEQGETREAKCSDNDSRLLPAFHSQKAVAPGGLPGSFGETGSRILCEPCRACTINLQLPGASSGQAVWNLGLEPRGGTGQGNSKAAVGEGWHPGLC